MTTEEVEVRLVKEHEYTNLIKYSDIDGIYLRDVMVKRNSFNGKRPPKKITAKLTWEE